MQPYAGDVYSMWKFLVLPPAADLFELHFANLKLDLYFIEQSLTFSLEILI